MSTERERERERGFTVVELMVTMAIAMSVMASILGVLVSQSRAERRVSSFADNQELLRQAMVQLQKDIRSAEPLELLPNPGDYALQIDLNVYEDISSPPVPITWYVDTATGELRREIKGTNGNPNVVTYRVGGVVNSYALDNNLFSFYKANGDKFDLTTDSAADIAQCAVRIRVKLRAAPNRGPEPAQLLSDTQLRNRLPGGIGCPQTPSTNVTEP